jgi:hypothetical protein
MFRFTIREVVLVTAIVAIGLGWWLDHGQLEYRATRAELFAQDAMRAAASFKNTLDVLTPDWREKLDLDD